MAGFGTRGGTGIVPIRDGEVMTACQQACPNGAIVFGNVNPEAGKAKVQELKKSKLNYGLLTDLNTFPRTTYLAEVKNPNEKLVAPAAAALMRARPWYCWVRCASSAVNALTSNRG